MASGQLAAQALARHSDYETTKAYVEVADELRRSPALRAANRPALRVVRAEKSQTKVANRLAHDRGASQKIPE